MSRRIAIVEDEAAIRENYADVLRKQGYEVQTYANRKDAMAAFDIRLPNLAIIDIGLENEIDGGFTLCQALRSLSDTLPIIFLTARDNDFDTVSGLRMGADDYLTKDISLPHLTARIAALFRRLDVIDQPPSPENLLQRGKLSGDLQCSGMDANAHGQRRKAGAGEQTDSSLSHARRQRAHRNQRSVGVGCCAYEVMPRPDHYPARADA